MHLSASRNAKLSNELILFLLFRRFGMMITQLNVINVFTDEFDQIKAEGKLVPPRHSYTNDY